MGTAILYGFNALGFIALWRWGEWPERVAAAMTVVFIAVTPFVGQLHLGSWRVGVGLSDLALLIGFVILSERRGRWWLILASSAQLAVVVTHIVPMLVPGEFALAGYVLRLGFWLLISITFFIGAWEAWADRRYRLEETHHGQSRPNPS